MVLQTRGHCNEEPPSVPIDKLEAPNNTATGKELHQQITNAQRSEYQKLEQSTSSGDEVSWEDIRDAEIRAHTNVGFSESQATAMAEEGISHYRQNGINRPTKIPWGRELD